MITDVGLPGMNGRQLAEIARTHRPELKVLFMTGYAENVSLRSDQLPAKMKVIAKPFVLDALATTVRDMIAAD
jgi:CheY-like chemotaxis protein